LLADRERWLRYIVFYGIHPHNPVSIEKSADFEMDGQRKFTKFSLPVGGKL
jgi:hypothetical protein